MAEAIEPAVELQPFNHVESALGDHAMNPAADANNLEHGGAGRGRDAHIQPRWTRWIDVNILVVGIPASIVGATFVALNDDKAAAGFTAFGVLLALQVFLRTVILDAARLR
jgi:energy-converting hydrogenase Eha subunit E